MTVRVGVDTGGTFTDVILYDTTTNDALVTKTPSTPPNFDLGVLTGVSKILEEAGTDSTEVSFLTHGTTVATNAVLENELPKLGLITNEGLRDVLEIGDQTRPELYNLFTDKPPAIIPRYLRKGVKGRVGADGEIVEEMDEAEVTEVVANLETRGVESIVVSMLFSYLNDEQEKRIGDIIEERGVVNYALSSEVHPEIREYDRTVTTVINEGVKNVISEYFEDLKLGVNELGISATLNVMHSGGGIFSIDQAKQNAVRTILSGPAGGAVATRNVAQSEGYSNAIGMDMGGTSADVSITRDSEIIRTTESEINNLPVKTPMIDIATVGAGGGSIAWIDDGGALRVGPKSASADPGPICYGQGGEKPTVSDANLLLGRLNPDNFLGGDLDLVVDKTRRLFREQIAGPLNQSIEEAALSVLSIANASLVRNIRKVTVERGHDPRNFVLVAFGGAGPLQATDIAIDMNINKIIVPRNPGVFSARGILLSDIRSDVVHSYRGSSIDVETLQNQFEDLRETLNERFRDYDEDEIHVELNLDLRYEGQGYELTVTLDERVVDENMVQDVIDRFHSKHEQLYGYSSPDEPVEIVTLRVNGFVPTPDVKEAIEQTGESSHQSERTAYFEEYGEVSTKIYNRERLPPGESLEGPAILEEAGSTTVVPPNTDAKISDSGNLIIITE